MGWTFVNGRWRRRGREKERKEERETEKEGRRVRERRKRKLSHPVVRLCCVFNLFTYSARKRKVKNHRSGQRAVASSARTQPLPPLPLLPPTGSLQKHLIKKHTHTELNRKKKKKTYTEHRLLLSE